MNTYQTNDLEYRIQYDPQLCSSAKRKGKEKEVNIYLIISTSSTLDRMKSHDPTETGRGIIGLLKLLPIRKEEWVLEEK